MLELGIRAKDKVNGFEGTVTGRVEYISGDISYLIEKDGGEKELWVNAKRVEVL